VDILFYAALLGIIPMIIAKNKGRDPFAWWLFGALLFIVALPWSLCLSDRNGRACPYCCERIKAEARVCRFCGKDLRGNAAG
jgi:hypothetical protein